jgi:hypothetical protein
MKTAKITTAYCREILERNYRPSHVFDSDETGSDEINYKLVKRFLEESDQNSRFKVSYDPQSYGSDEEDSWDLVGPALSYGHVYFKNREEAEEARDAMNAILREHFGPIRRSPELTTDAHRNRVVLDGDCCPACGSTKVSKNEGTFRGSVYVVLKDCDDCNAEWRDVYGLQGYQDLRID